MTDDGPETAEKPWVLFVCEDDERNICDQKVIEVQLQHRYGISSMRKTMAEIAREGSCDASSKKLFVNGKEIGFVYYRTGYQLEQYLIEGASPNPDSDSAI